ncbi:uncharacterized protein LOC126747340 [Anthonomus grandis grandis]|uniref:uncharacterized protein LOC126747340 n=1 Tax=Anthonomus grandis grandis TaxID=2921223 RepID=UPI002165B4EA|nr:uncharacterized protein LOC126747340 [Anthonomus grandis grandis]
MILEKDRQTFSKSIGIIIAIQGLAWFGISVTGIVVKQTTPSIAKKDLSDIQSYTQYIARIIYDNFLVSNARDKVIRPQDFEAFLWIYTVLSGIWVAAALDLNLAIRFKKSRQSYSALVLGVVVLLTSVIDLVLFSLLARDYSTCPFSLSSTSEVTTTDASTTIQNTEIVAEALMPMALTITTGTTIDCKVATGIVMSIAARGYVLWLINVVTAICLISIGTKVFRSPGLLGYEKNTIPRVKFPEQKKGTSANNDFLYYGDNDAFQPQHVTPSSRPRSNNSSTPVVLSSRNQNNYF